MTLITSPIIGPVRIQFPATPVPSSNIYTLDDYREDDWTPNIGGSATYTTQTGRYVKWGKLVWISGRLTINVRGTGSTTLISGLPFPSANNGLASTVFVSYFDTLAVSTIFLTGRVDVNASTIGFNGMAASGPTMAGDVAIFGNGAQVRFSAVYEAAA